MMITIPDFSDMMTSRYDSDEDVPLPTVLVSPALERKLTHQRGERRGVCGLIPDYTTYMMRSPQSQYPQQERDLEVYSTWSAGPDHVDLDNSQTVPNR